MTATATVELYKLPIDHRPAKTWRQLLNALLFGLALNLGFIMINGSQFAFLLPLRLLPFAWSRQLYEDGIRYTKGAFGNLLILMCQWFGPTKFVMSFETEGQGKFSPEEVDRVVARDRKGRVVGLNLPQRTVIIANHQIYADWWYAWALTHYTGTSKHIYIVLKDTLKWIPMLGWGMQFFNFIFLSRSWNADRLTLSTSLAVLGRNAEKENTPLAFLLYPEGTLVSKDTRPISKKFADKEGVPDMEHTLLPRSKGLHYSLRSLSPRIHNLQLIDMTMAYPGVPEFGYGQSWYTLRSIFANRVPPPAVHIHFRKFDVTREVPIGDVSASNPDALPTPSQRARTVEVDVPEPERIAFERWLRDLWRDKDRAMGTYHATGSFLGTKGKQSEVVLPLELRSWREILDAFCFFVPALLCYAWAKLRGQ